MAKKIILSAQDYGVGFNGSSSIVNNGETPIGFGVLAGVQNFTVSENRNVEEDREISNPNIVDIQTTSISSSVDLTVHQEANFSLEHMLWPSGSMLWGQTVEDAETTARTITAADIATVNGIYKDIIFVTGGGKTSVLDYSYGDNDLQIVIAPQAILESLSINASVDGVVSNTLRFTGDEWYYTDGEIIYVERAEYVSESQFVFNRVADTADYSFGFILNGEYYDDSYISSVTANDTEHKTYVTLTSSMLAKGDLISVIIMPLASADFNGVQLVKGSNRGFLRRPKVKPVIYTCTADPLTANYSRMIQNVTITLNLNPSGEIYELYRRQGVYRDIASRWTVDVNIEFKDSVHVSMQDLENIGNGQCLALVLENINTSAKTIYKATRLRLDTRSLNASVGAEGGASATYRAENFAIEWLPS